MFTIDVTRYSSPNFDQRSTPITYVVIHSCEGHPLGNEQASSIPWLCNPAAKVSSHYYVTREGRGALHRTRRRGVAVHGLPLRAVNLPRCACRLQPPSAALAVS